MNLEKLLNYQNKAVLNRYKSDFPQNKLSAAQAFNELLKYFWLQQKHTSETIDNQSDKKLGFVFSMHFEMKEIDDMWHTFLLFTKDYAEFCQKYFGYFIHHQPNIAEEKISTKQFKTDFSRFLSYVYDNLGQETIEIWFAELFVHEQ